MVRGGRRGVGKEDVRNRAETICAAAASHPPPSHFPPPSHAPRGKSSLTRALIHDRSQNRVHTHTSSDTNSETHSHTRRIIYIFIYKQTITHAQTLTHWRLTGALRLCVAYRNFLDEGTCWRAGGPYPPPPRGWTRPQGPEFAELFCLHVRNTAAQSFAKQDDNGRGYVFSGLARATLKRRIVIENRRPYRLRIPSNRILRHQKKLGKP